MSAYEYLTVNSLTAYPFKDGRAVNSVQPIDADVFLDILFVLYDSTIKRPYIKQIKSEDGGVSIDFYDADGDLKIFTVEVPSSELINHYKNFNKCFFGYKPADYRPKASVKLVFGPGVVKIAETALTVNYTPEETEISPSAVQYSVPEVSTLEFESWFPDFDSGDYNPNAGQDIISVNTFLREQEVKMRYGFNNVFNYLAPKTMYLDVARGAGLGLYDPCTAVPPHDVITRINQVEPDSNGNIYFKVSDCHSLRLLTDDERNSALERILAGGTDYVNFNVKHYLKFWDQLPYQNYNETISPNGKNVNILGDGQNGTINSINHGFVLENHCKPKCPHENLNAFAEYLNRVKDGVSELFKIVENPIETCGYATIDGRTLTAVSFCDENIVDSGWLEAPLCNQGFKKYFHEGRKIKLRYNNSTFYNPEIVEVIESQNGLNTQIILDQELPDFLPEQQYLFKVADFGLINKLNFEIVKHNNSLITTNSPYIDFNYGTVDAFNNDDEYVTFITTVTVIYNPGEEEINVSFISTTNDLTTLVATSVKVKYPDGEIRYGEYVATIPCKGYAIWEAIFYVPCSPEPPAEPNEGHVIISVINSDTGEVLENAPKEVKLNSASCVNIDISTIRTSAKENALFKFNIVNALNLSGVSSISFSGDLPEWLNRNTSPQGELIPGIEDTNTYHLWGTPTASNQGILNEEFAIDVTVNASGVFRTKLFLSYIAKPRITSHTNGQIIEINPPDTFSRIYTQGSPLIRINATNTPIDYRFESSIPGFGQAGANSNKFIGRYGYNPTFTFPITYPVRLFAKNSASLDSDELYVDIFVKVYNTGQTASTAFQDIPYCFTIPNPDSATLTLISTLPAWLTFDRNAEECNLSGLNNSNISVVERVVIRYDYSSGFENKEYSIGYRARPVITYPPPQTGNNIFTLELRPPDYTASGSSKIYTQQNPLISVKVLDASSSGLEYFADNLPDGLEIDPSGNIVGQIDEDVIPGDYFITLRVNDPAFSGIAGSTERQIKLTLTADEKLVIARENANFCLKFQELSSASSYTITNWLDGIPTWLTQANRIGAACHLASSDNLKPNGDLNRDYRFTLAYITASNPPIQLQVNYILRYIARPRVLYPENGTVFKISSENLSELGFTEQNPLLTFDIVNNPTNYQITGLPQGLSLVNGKIVGTITGTNPIGEYNVILYAGNSAGTSTVNIKIIVEDIVVERAFQLTPFCYKITGISDVLYYSLEGDKPDWLTFNPSIIAACPQGNLYGTAPITANQNQTYNLVLVAHRNNGELRQSFKLEYYAKPVITYPLPDTVFTISPPDYNTLFSSNSPLLQIEATNSPTSFTLTGAPTGTFRVDSFGKIIGTSGGAATTSPIPVLISVGNLSGISEAVRIYFSVSPAIKTIEFLSTVNTPCAPGAKYKFELEDRPENITLTGNPTWITFDPSLTTDCNLTFGDDKPVFNTPQLIPLTLTRNYRGGKTRESFNLLVKIPPPGPAITYPSTGLILTLRPPDYVPEGSSKIFTDETPLLRVSTNNSPTSFVAAGLPQGLSTTLTGSTGRIVGQIASSVLPGDYQVILTVANANGSDQKTITLRLVSSEQSATILENSNFCIKFSELANSSTAGITWENQSSGLPWIIQDMRASAACNLSGRPTGIENRQYRFTLTYSVIGNPALLNVGYSLNYIARPRIVFPAAGEIITVTLESLPEGGYTEQNPLLTLNITNNPTSYQITGLPPGLSLVNEKIVGTLSPETPIGNYLVVLETQNSAGTSVFTFTIKLIDIILEKAYEGQAFCYKITGISDVVDYSYTGTLPSWLTFNPETSAICPEDGNLVGIPAGSSNQLFDLVLIGNRPSGETISQKVRIEYYAKPVITYPLPDTVFTISPPDYNNTLFTSTNPLFQITASNSPNFFRVNGFPVKTFRIDGSGNIIGSSGATVVETPVPVQLYARNEAGESAPITIFIIITNQIKTITFNYTIVTPCTTGAKYKFELEDRPENITLTGNPTWITFDPSLTTDCNLTFGDNRPTLTTSQTIPLTLTRNYRGGKTRESFNLLVTTVPIITNPINTTSSTNRIRYVISQPDFNNRIYTTQTPLLTITATNSPTSITATGLPASLSVVSSGTDIGKIISTNQNIPVTQLGLFTVTATAINGAGSSNTVIFEVEVKNEIIEISTQQGKAISSEFCKLITRDRATSYSIVTGTLLNGLNFSGSIDAACNFFGIPSGGNDEISILDIRSNYVGGFSNFRIRFLHINRPTIVRFTRNGNTIIDDNLSILPGVYVGTTFTEELPLFSIETTGNPTSFYADGFPQNSTLSISCNGKAVGTIDQSASGKYTVIITAVNEAGESPKRTIYLDFSQAVPTITWSNPDDITYPTPLNSIDHLNATADVPGTFSYLPPAGNILSASTQPRVLTVTFTPTDNVTYAQVAKSVTIRVFKGTPVLTWNTPAPISYYTALSSTQLNASANIPGTFIYNPSLGHMFNAGTHSITATFTPVDSTNYNNATRQIQLTVNKIVVTSSNIYWSNPSSIVFGVALSGTQLNALARISSTDATSPAIPSNSSSYSYSPAAGTILNVGTHNLTVTFVSSDSTNFTVTPVQKTITISVVSQAPAITWNNPAAITYGTALSSTQLNASSSVTGLTYTYTPAIGAILNAGTQTLSLTVSGNPNYSSTTITRQLVVNKAASSIIFTSPSSGRVGEQIILTTEKTGSSAAVTYSSASTAIINITQGNRANLLSAGSASVAAQVAEDSNYLAAARTQTISISRGISTVTITSTNSTKVGSSFALTATSTGSTGQISFSSGNSNLLSITGGSTATAVGAGQVTLTASVPSTANYDAASTTQTITIAKGDSNIASINMVNLFQGETSTITLQKTGSNGAVTYTSSNTNVISISGNTATFNSAGTANITATLAADNNYLGATRTQAFTISSKTAVTITWTGVTTLELGQTVNVLPFSFTDPATFDGLVTATSSDATVIRVISLASVTGPVLEAIKPGTTQITFRVPGTTDRQEATLIVPMTVPKIAGTITINNLVNNTLTVPLSTTSYFISYGISPTSSAYGGSAPALDPLTSSNTAVATRDANNTVGHVNLLSVGNTTITFNRPSNAFWESVSRSFTLSLTKGSSTLSITGPTTAKVGGTGSITFTKTGSSATPAFTAASSTGFTINGTTISYTRAGSFTFTGNLAGDTNYNGITATRTLSVAKGDSTIGFQYFVNGAWTNTKPTSVLPGSRLRIRRVVTGSTGLVTLTATPSSNLGPTSECSSENPGVCEAILDFNDTSFDSQTLVFSLASDTNYNAASATTTITIQKGTSTLTITSPTTLTYGVNFPLADIVVTKTGSTGAITYTSSQFAVGVFSGNLIPRQVGSSFFTGTLAADNAFGSATATRTVTINKGTPTLTFMYGAVFQSGQTVSCTSPNYSTTKPSSIIRTRRLHLRVSSNMTLNNINNLTYSITPSSNAILLGVCSLQDNSLVIAFDQPTTGTATLTVSWPGDSNTNSTSVSTTFNIV
jgi:hypothetical protein